MVKKVGLPDHVCHPPPGYQPPPEKTNSSFPFSTDSLSSMVTKGCDFGSMVFALCSVAFSKSISWFSSCLKKKEETQSAPTAPPSPTRNYDLSHPNDLRKAFRKDPVAVVMKVLSLLETEPAVAQEILVNLATDWKAHPKRYLEYNKKTVQGWKSEDKGKNARANSMRMEAVAVFDEIFRRFILTPEQLRLDEKINMGDLSEAERNAMRMSDELWEQCRDKSPKLVTFRENYHALLAARDKATVLWDFILTKLEGDWSRIMDLRSDSDDEHLEGRNGKMTFGHMVERMLYVRYLHSLRSTNVYANAQKQLLEMLLHLRNSNDAMGRSLLQEYPNIKQIILKVTALLSDDKRAGHIRFLIREIIQIIDPIKKSPPR